MIITVKDISRSFQSTKREEGWTGALGLLVKPQVQTHEALKKVNFSIEAGSFVGLIGANGAGKTTLLKILSGLIPPSSGEATVLGFDPFKRKLEFRKKIALVMGQKAQLWWDLPALDAFELLRAIYEIPNKIYKDRLNYLAHLLDVKGHLNTQIRRLSLGERMKMELIGAILHWPSVIFLDEPTIGLDVLAAHKLREFLKVFNLQEKATIILTSHNMDDIERLCSRVLILKSGELIYDGQPGGLTEKGVRNLRIRTVESPTLKEVAQVTQLNESQIEISQNADDELDSGAASGSDSKRLIHIHIQQEQIVPVLQKLMSRYQIVDMGVEGPSLEKVIQRLYASE